MQFIQRYSILLLLPLLSACSTVSDASVSTSSFLTDNLIFIKPVSPYDSRKQLPANLSTLAVARMENRPPPIDPYYPDARPWDKEPQGTNSFYLYPVNQYR